MRKVTKILGMIVSATILLLILLPIFISLLLSLPVIQNKVVGFATQLLTDQIGSEVNIGRVDVTMRGYLEVEDLLVRDSASDTLLYLKNTKSKIAGFSRKEHSISLGRSTIDGATFNLREMESGEMNVREVVLKLTRQKLNKRALIVEVSEIEVENFNLVIARREHLNPEYGVDMRNLRINNMAAHVRDLMVDGPAIHAHIETMSGVEQSGFEIADIGGELYVTSGALSLTNMKLDSRWSSLRLDHLTIADQDWVGYRDFNNSTTLSFGVRDGYISSDDVAYFAPALRDWGVTLYDLDFDMMGQVNRMSLDLNNLSFGEGTSLAATLDCVGVTSPSTATTNLKLTGLTTVASDIDQLVTAATSKELDSKTLSYLSALGTIVVRGEAKGGMSNLWANASLQSDAGSAASEMTITPNGSQPIQLKGDVTIDNMDLGRVLHNRDLGVLNLTSSIEGALGETDYNILVDGHVETMQWRDYPLHNIEINSHITPNFIGGGVVSRDPKLQFDLTARGLNLLGERPEYRAMMDLKVADLKALNINRRDTISQLSALVNLTAEGRDVEDGSARVVIESGEYRYNSNILESNSASLEIESHTGDRSVKLKSKFVDGEFHSINSVAHIMEYLKGSMAAYLPSLYNQPQKVKYNLSTIMDEERRAERGHAALEANLDSMALSQITLMAHNLNPVTEAVSEGLQVGDGSTATLRFNIPQQLFDLQLRSGYLERKSMLAIGVDVQMTNRGDSVAVSGDVRELFLGLNYMEGVKLRAGAHKDVVNISAGFENKSDDSSADLSAVLNFSRSAMGRQDIRARLLPSTINREGNLWDLSARSVDITERGIDIDMFKMESRNQRMTLDGVASRSLADTVRMQMHNFDLSILSSFIARLGYYIEGQTNGSLIASSLLDNARLEAKVALDSIKVNTIPAPAMDMSVDWDFKQNRARLFLSDRVNRDTLIRGYYMPSQVRYYAKFRVDSVDMGLIDPPLGGVITDTRGLADLDLTLQGQRREADLSGTIHVQDLSTRVDYTNVRYTIPEATISVNNNMLSGQNAMMYDKSGGSGRVDVTVDLQHLSNIKYDLKIQPDNMLVLDTSERDNDLFYGDLYASGAATISGDKSGVRMNITASSAGDSHFFMPLSSKSTISTADFITFAKPVVIDSVDQIYHRRQLFERKSKGKGNANAITLNMALDVKSNTELQLVIDPTVGDIIKARGEGKMNLKIEPQSNIFEIYGDYTIDEGSYLFTLQNIVNKRFVINPGSSIQWSGSPLDALLDIDAIYKLKTSLQPIMVDESSRAVPVDCVIHLGDRLTHPDVSFDIELPSSDPEQQAALANLLNDQETISRQFFYLMLANSFIPESSGMTGDFGVSTTAATGFELLTNQLSNWLSTSNYNVIIRYRPESELTGEEVDFGFSKGLINNRLLVELEGNYVIDNKQAVSEDASNFMGEAYITWLIDRAGALRLRGFTQTIDRYDENQGLQETGIGIYYREDFDNFQDLKERVKARFSRKKR